MLTDCQLKTMYVMKVHLMLLSVHDYKSDDLVRSAYKHARVKIKY